MRIFLMIAMAFIAPMAGITIFILIDKGMDKLFNCFKNKGRNKRYLPIEPVKPGQNQATTGLPPVIQTAPSATAPQPLKASGCKTCAGCKLAAKGGCARRKQADSSNQSSGQ